MKLKVEKRFRDKLTGALHIVDDIIEVSDKRGEELLADERNFVTKFVEDKPAKEEAKKEETPAAEKKPASKKTTKAKAPAKAKAKKSSK